MAGEDEISARWMVVRRLFHIALSATVIYYWLPDIIFEPNVGKWAVLLIGGVVVLCIEIPRLILGKRLPWGRGYELRRPASYAYAALGAIIVLLLFPPAVGALAIAAMALADPVAGELRRMRFPTLWVATAACAVYAIIALSLTLLIAQDVWTAVLMTIAMASLAILAEDIDIKGLDDDLTMIILPAIVGYLVYASLS